MLFVKIALGLFGLGIVVFFHELGHFLAARLVGIKVDAFSIGWGNPILKKKIGDTEYRLGVFPVGGYCKMHGDSDYNNEAYVNLEKGIKPEKGSYLAASPLARILVSIGGPLFNLLLAIILLSIIWGVGFEVNTFPNKIILASEFEQNSLNPADIAGLKSGDIITHINGNEITNYNELREAITVNPNKTLSMKIKRDGIEHLVSITPSLDKSTGAGRIGIYPWIDPVIETIFEDTAALRKGLLSGDIITSINGNPIYHNRDFERIVFNTTENIILEYNRLGVISEIEFTALELQEKQNFEWKIINYRTPKLSPVPAFLKGTQESFKTLALSVKSLGLLFRGIDLTQAVSGPVRITYMMGDVAAAGFGQDFGTGIHFFFYFIAIISIALCIMNMLPLPILDGGMIILFIVEMIRRKPAHPKAISIFQTCGIIIIVSLMLLALFGDIMFFIRL